MTSDTSRVLEELATACRELAQEGHEDGNLAHLAARDPAGRGFWLKRSGIGISEVEGPADFVLLDLDGEQLEGDGGRHLEWPIHAEIMRARPDVTATAHTHATPLRIFAATDVELAQLLAESTAFVDGLPRFDATTHLIDTPRLGRALAASLGDRRAVNMANHGATVVGRTVAEMCVLVICLTRAVETQLALASSEWPMVEIDPVEAVEKGERIYCLEMMAAHWSYYVRRDARRRRSIDARASRLDVARATDVVSTEQ